MNLFLTNKISFVIDDTIFEQWIENFLIFLSFLNLYLLILNLGAKIFYFLSRGVHQSLLIQLLTKDWLFLSPFLSRICVQHIMRYPISCYKIKDELKRWLLEIYFDWRIAFVRSRSTWIIILLSSNIFSWRLCIKFWI